MTTPDLITHLLLDTFAACDSAQSLQLDGDAAADVLVQWACYRGLSVEREQLSREDGRITWTQVRVTLPMTSPRLDRYVTASRSDDQPRIASALDRACRTITGFDTSDVNGLLDAEASAFPTDEDLP